MSPAADKIAEVIDELTVGWQSCQIHEVAEVNPRIDKKAIPDDIEVSFVPMPAVEAESGVINVSETKLAKEVKKGFTAFLEGDVLFAKITPCMENGKMAIVPTLINGYGFGSTEFHVLRPGEGLLPKYLYYYVSSKRFRGEAERYMTGAVGQKRVSTTYIKEATIPVAPVEDQRRIVAEIEKQFSRLDEAVASLKRVKANLKRYKAAVLKAAVEGKLTEEWRKQNSDIEPASRLLARILADRRTKWEEAEIAKMKAKGAVPKNGKWKEKYKELEPLLEDETFDIPTSWAWTNLGQVSWSVKDGPHYSPKYSEEGIPFISGGNIRPDGIDFSSAKYVSKELHEELSARCKPRAGDLLYTKGGTTGIAYFNTETRDFNVWVHVAVIRLAEGIGGRFLQNALNSSHCYRQSQLYTHGVGNQDLGLTRMIKITLPLPPIEEQEQINIELDQRMSVAQDLENQINNDIKKTNQARQSILTVLYNGSAAQRRSMR